MPTAVKLYELGRLSSGRAAERAGMGRVEFLLSLARYEVFPCEAELRDLEAQGASGYLDLTEPARSSPGSRD